MLFQLRELWERQGFLLVSDVYGIFGHQSGSTSYRQLMALKNLGLVDIAIVEADRRKRSVTFTAQSELFFERLDG